MNNNITTADEQYMRRCLQLALMAEGRTYPNPMVGSVIVCDGRIIGEGYHRKAGTPHAEVNAVASVKDKSLLANSTLYVNLEPCAHWGRTPPCAKLIIDSHIPRVVVGCVDTFSEVSGKGIAMMREAGVDVRVGLLEQECRYVNRRFFTYHEKQRPYVLLKWAESADGYIDALRDAKDRPVWFTNEECRRLVHKQRTEECAVMIGADTALLDNPSLTARSWQGNQPMRIVIDLHGRTYGAPLKLFTDGGDAIVLSGQRNGKEGNVQYVRVESDGMSVKPLLKALYDMEVQSVIVEGGRVTLQRFIDEGVWDEAWRYVGTLALGDGVPAPRMTGEVHSLKRKNIEGVVLDIVEKKH